MRNIMPCRRFVTLPALVALATVAFGSAAMAHPGHEGGLAGGLAHPFTGLDHMLAMVAVGLWASQLGRRAIWLLPVLFPAVMVAGAAMGASGLPLPWVEAGILASVVVLGAAVALQLQVSVGLGAALVAVSALFHGYAHGAELPAVGSAVLYGVGFVIATIALHGIRIALGTLANRQLVLRSAGGAIAAAGMIM